MCGICGVLGSFDRHRVPSMMKVLRHRGPDGQGQYDDGQYCALGHQRLAIIDLSPKGSQPMSNESQTIWSVVNGEIYNYKSLREQLQAFGHVFLSDCDSEVITHAYEQHGEDFPNRLRGMFALAVYDRSKQKLILARDPVGEKPLYYWQSGSRLMFASEIKALFEAGVPKEIDCDRIPSWLLYQYLQGGASLFRGVSKLLPGHILVTSATGDTRVEPYWVPSRCDLPDTMETQDALDTVKRLLEESVRLRLQSDVPVGAFLSGGVDSSIVAALYRKHYTGRLHTFTASFPEHSEAPYARAVSQYLSAEYHEVSITAGMVARDLHRITWHHDEPLGDAAVVCNYYLAQEAKKHTTVVLAGEGGDELFGGYPWYKYAPLLRAVSRTPVGIRKLAGYLLPRAVTSKFYRWQRLAALLGVAELEQLLMYPTTAMSIGNIDWLLTEWVRNHGRWRCGWRGLQAPVDPHAHMMALDFMNLLPEKFLMKADKGTMAWAVEERLPLLDKAVVEYVATLPHQLKRDKWLLRKVAEEVLPREIAWRPKQGFGTPVGAWLRGGPVLDLAADRISHGELLKEICNKNALAAVSQYLHSQNRGGKLALDPAGAIWGLTALQIWYDVWFGGAQCA